MMLDLLAYAFLALITYKDEITDEQLAEIGLQGVRATNICIKDGKDVVAWIFEDSKQSELVCVFRGTDSLKDVLYNIRVFSVNFYIGQECCGKVHRGFFEYYNKIRNEGVLDMLLDKCLAMQMVDTKVKVTFVGHSLGGCVILCALDFDALMLYRCKRGIDIQCVTFGAPPLGDDEFKQNVLKKIPNITRVVYDSDIIPRLPLHRHIVNAVVIPEITDHDDTRYDLVCKTQTNTFLLKCVEHHNMNRYICGIKKYKHKKTPPLNFIKHLKIQGL
jgi:hypothetical protein